MKFKNTVKKIMICGSSLLMMASLGSGAVSAKHTHVYHSIRVTRQVHKVNNHKVSNHEFNHLEKTMSKDLSSNIANLMTKKDAKYIKNQFKKLSPKLSSVQLIRLDNNFGLSDYYGNGAISRHDYKYIQKKLHVIHTAQKHQKEIQQQKQIAQQEKQEQQQAQQYKAELNQAMNQGDDFNNALQKRLISDINQTRKDYGRVPLQVTFDMQDTANYRTPKVQYAYEHLNDYLNYPHNTSNPLDNWIHGGDTHQSGYDYINNKGYKVSNWGANAGGWYKRTNICNDDGQPMLKPNTTPENIADNIDDMIMNHDTTNGNNNGHRNIELNPNYRNLGVGITYDPSADFGTFNEQFSN